MLGGYQTITFNNVPAFDGTIKIKDAFTKAKKGKAILIENLFIDTGVSVSGFTYDITPTDETKAVLPITAITDNTIVTIGLVINANDSIAIYGE